MSQNNQHIDIVDATSLFMAMKWISESLNINKIRIDYKRLSDYLDEIRKELGWPKSEKKLVICSVNPLSSFQKSFLKAMEEGGFINIDIDYRSLFRGISYNYYGPGRPISSDVTHILSFMLGKLGKDSSVTVVSGDFSISYPLIELSKTNNSRTAIYFSDYLLDSRWEKVLNNQESNIEMFNMDGDIPKLTDNRISLIKKAKSSSFKRKLVRKDVNEPENIFQGS